MNEHPDAAQRRIQELEHIIEEQKRIDEALQAIAEATASTSAMDFFYSLARAIATVLNVRYVALTECTDAHNTHVRTLVSWNGTDFEENYEYALEGHPCHEVINGLDAKTNTPGREVFYGQRLSEIFPKEDTESYLGLPLQATNGHVLGHLEVWDNGIIQNSGWMFSVLRIFTARAAVELERQQVEQQLRLSEQRYRSVFETNPLPVVVYDLETLRFMAVNSAAMRHYGYSEAEFLSMRFTDLLAEPLEDDLFMETVPSSVTWPYAFQHRKKDGTVIFVQTTRRILMFDGRASCISVVNDVTETRRLEEEREQAYQSLEQRVRDRTQEIERRRLVAESLRDILTMLNSNKPLGSLLDYIVMKAGLLLGSDGGVICSQEANADCLVRGRHGIALEHGQVISPQLPGYDAMMQAFTQRHPISITEVGQGRRDPAALSTLAPFRALIAVPLIIKDEIYGALLLYYKKSRRFSEEEIDLAAAFSDQVGLAIENALLREQVGQIAVLEERNRLARELHDAVSQTLWSASVLADVLPDLWERNIDNGRKRLEQLRQLTRVALAEMRGLLLELRPSALTEVSMGELLERLVSGMQARTGMKIKLMIDGNSKLPPEVQVALYRIAQEALNNAARHASASMVQVFFSARRGRVILTVLDNGRGFNISDVTSSDSLGIKIMQERARAINAALRLESNPGEGTQVVEPQNSVDW